jgi:hypothetical protein
LFELICSDVGVDFDGVATGIGGVGNSLGSSLLVNASEEFLRVWGGEGRGLSVIVWQDKDLTCDLT